MSSPNGEQRGTTETRTIELDGTTITQRAVHEAVGHVYDEFAVDCATREDAASVPDEVFDRLEELYVATAEDSVSRVELTYEVESDGEE